MRISKKILAIALSILMAVSMMPFTVFAATVEVANGAELKAAVESASSGDVIEFTADNTTYPAASGALVIDVNGKDITIDLKGHTQYFRVSGETAVVYETALFYIHNGAKLTLKDSVGGGAMYATYGANSPAYMFILKDKTTDSVHTSELVIDSGKYVMDKANYGNITIYQNYAGASTTINGGEFETETGAKNRRDYIINDSRGEVEINGGTFTPSSSSDYVVYEGNTTETALTINGGEFNGTMSLDNTKADTEINAGTFKNVDGSANVTVNNFVPAEKLVDETTGEVKSVDASTVIKVGSQEFDNLADAAAAANAATYDVKLVFLQDVTQANGIALNNVNGKKITVDLNGHTYTCTSGSNVNRRAIRVDGGKVDITSSVAGGKIVAAAANPSTSSDSDCYGPIRTEGGTTTISNITLENNEAYGLGIKNVAGSVTMTNVTVNSSVGGGIEVAGTASLTNCTFNQTGLDSAHKWISSCVAVCYGGTLTVNSGTYTSENYAIYPFSSGGTINVKDGTFTAPEVIHMTNNPSEEDYAGASVVNVTGGTLTGGIYDTVSANGVADINIGGGSFSTQIETKWCADNFVPAEQDPGTGLYTVEVANNSASLTVSDEVGLNIYANESNYPGAVTYRVTANAYANEEADYSAQVVATGDVADLPDGTGDYDGYKIVSMDFAPAQINEDMTVEFFDASGDTLGSITYAIVDYLNEAANSTDTTTANLAKALKYYGYYAQQNYSYNKNTSKSLWCGAPSVTQATPVEASSEGYVSGLELTGEVSYVCLSKASLRFYFTEDTNDFYSSLDYELTSAIGTAAFGGTESEWYIEVSGIDATDLNEDIELVITNTADGSSKTVHFSACTWGAKKGGSFGKSIRCYESAAVAYAAAHNA